MPVNEQSARTVLGSFLFRGDDVFKPVAVLSGGEKSRLALVKLLLNPPNLLLMDEPTTHLDMASIDALIQALDQYEGTLIFISHDVHFIRALARKVLHIDTGKLTPYAGGYDYYLEKSKATDARDALTVSNAPAAVRVAPVAAPSSPSQHPTARKSKEQKRAEAEARSAVSREQPRTRGTRAPSGARDLQPRSAPESDRRRDGGRIDLPAARPSHGTQPRTRLASRTARPPDP